MYRHAFFFFFFLGKQSYEKGIVKVSEKILADNVKNAEITMTVQNDEIVLSVKQ